MTAKQNPIQQTQVCQIIGGSIGKLIARQKSGKIIEIGELLTSDLDENQYAIYQVQDVYYSTQMEQRTIELISGMQLENQESDEIEFFDSELRAYNIVQLKCLAIIEKQAENKFKIKTPKTIPNFFSNIYPINEKNLIFLKKPNRPLYFGKLRSGSKIFNRDVFLDADDVLSHHILFCATTGKGKSNFIKNILWNNIELDSNGILVLDAHDEYYGRGTKKGLKNHKNAKYFVSYYTNHNCPQGAKTFFINIADLKPSHFNAIGNFSDVQKEAMRFYYNLFFKDWISKIFDDETTDDLKEVQKETNLVLRRKLSQILSCTKKHGKLEFNDIFSLEKGQRIIQDIADELENGKSVIIDCSHFSGSIEMLVGSMIMEKIFWRYKNYSRNGQISNKPIISVVIEEAPRVIGRDVLQRGQNIFGTIAREGRKFKIGLIAITQLPSLIPREILANINTKVILGTEMQQEREAIISTTSQDLSDDSKNIASLNKGEAIISSCFVPFAIPIYCPLFEDVILKIKKNESKVKESVFGME
ncbi:MAG: ATPase [Candidatus Aenigmarchaeota archaeon ex4484_52]|nr:MAG: ATPase [Candidatus Aenigmarchaeota archaeon ex4484_52]